jgi:hypothetical protein
MSQEDAKPTAPPIAPPPLSWPPPGLEKLQGKLWKVIGISWAGSLILVLPLLWALAVEQPFYSLGPFEDNWQVGMGIAILGAVIILFAFGIFFGLMRAAARGADAGYGTLTILEVATDSGRDTGFLIQGKRHFGFLDGDRRAAIVSARLRGAGLVLAAALWFVVGFGIAVLLAARGFVTPSGIWLMTMGPTGFMFVAGTAVLILQNASVRGARSAWDAQEGEDRVQTESTAWADRLDQAGHSIVLGAGPKGEGGRFRMGATLVVILFLGAFVPTMTVAVTTSIGPILAEIAVPSFLSVQEMAGGAEMLRRHMIDKDPSITPAQAGAALQNIAFVGGGSPEAWEKRPATSYEEGWFPDPDYFPDPFSETVASDLMGRPLSDFSAEEQAAMRQAAAHPASEEFHMLAQAQLVDVVSGRWILPFPDTLTFRDLPWPRFQAFRTAGLAEVARAAVELSRGDRQQAEHVLEELISTGFLLIDQGPTMIDNLMGVVLTDMGGDALEAFYRRTGQGDRADALAWGRKSALAAAKKARAGMIPEDIHSLLQGVPDLVENEGALRGLRWEYFATFNMLAPCINLHKMVFGPDETYDAWRERARDELVRSRGERELFALAESGAVGAGGRELEGFLPRFLSLTLGSGGAPGSCASLIASLQSGS